MKENDQIQNVYAYNLMLQQIHISVAKSGRKGYLCIGCQKEMQAVISTKPNRISYFRHDHNAIKGFHKCTYSDETYRHKLAKDILLKNKRVKVPALYKYPPKNVIGIANLLSESCFIEACSVESELFFFENETGEICWNKTIFSNDKKYLLFKPDIIFFDSNKKPILFIEIVATHKISEQKLLDLKRIGIDTIQITIPKDSPENIEKIFEKTTRTKWVYNYEQETSNYIPVSDSNSERISSIDDDQRKLFEESYKCRTTQISNLIRTIRRCLDSQQFRTITGKLESEIFRVERNTEEHRKSLEEQSFRNKKRVELLRNELRERFNSTHRDKRERIDAEERNFESEENKFREYCFEENKKYESEFENHRTRIEQQTIEKYLHSANQIEQKYRDLEERYIRKRSEIDSKSEPINNLITELTEQNSNIGSTINQEREIINEITTESSRFERLSIDIGNKGITEQNDFTRAQEDRSKIESRFSRERNDLEAKFIKEERELEQRFKDFYKRIETEIETRNFGEDEYSRELKNFFKDMELIPNFINAQEIYQRYEKAWDCFTRKAYKNWHD